MPTDQIAKHQRALNGIPSEPDLAEPLPKRILTNAWTWITVGMTLVFATCLFLIYRELTEPRPVPGGEAPGFNNDALRDAASRAWPTLLFWLVVFTLLNAYRWRRIVLPYLALGWGACVSTFLSLYANTWASEQLNIRGDGDPTAGARTAIYVAPFVEEATKASVLFLIAILIRYQVVSKLQAITLAGLSAAGFAFTENILYYARVIMYASQTIGVGNAEEALNYIVFLRGVKTAFGHPLFTMMTGIGLAVGLRSKSKVVRVLAPVTGFLLGAFLHMFYNSQATLNDEKGFDFVYFLVMLPMVITAAIYVIRQIFAEGALIRERLDDYVRMGWLRDTDPRAVSRVRSRIWALLVAITRGFGCWIATVQFQNTLTELAYLRDAETKGLVDTATEGRARELLFKARSLRGIAIDNPTGMRLTLPRVRKDDPVDYSQPQYPGPSGLGGNWPTQPGSAPLGSQGYSAVDPTWGPPKP